MILAVSARGLRVGSLLGDAQPARRYGIGVGLLVNSIRHSGLHAVAPV